MVKVEQNNIAAAPKKQPRFNLKKRFKKLNSEQKHLLLKQYATFFNKTERSLYNAIQRDNQSDEELHFFAGIFDCKIQDLYTEPLKQVPSIYELQSKAHGGILGKQVSLDVN